MSAASDADLLAVELREAARCLAARPLVAAENAPDEFMLIRRHRRQLDQWFTQRFGYRLQVTADTARLFKTTATVRNRPLRTATAQPRPFSTSEYLMLALVLAAVVSGPNVISLRDLVGELRAAAAEAGAEIGVEPSDRRALVTALRWMIAQGLAAELHERIDDYAHDAEADAVLAIRPDRVALLPLPVLTRAESAAQLLERSGPDVSTRSGMRARILEEPVVYRDDFEADEWSELRRRLGEEVDFFDEMFGLHIEARAEGVMAVDPDGELSDVRFPQTGTVGHAALLLADHLAQGDGTSLRRDQVVAVVADFAAEHRSYWSQIADTPERLADEAVSLLADHRLVELDGDDVVVLPAAARYVLDISHAEASML
ncbi:TIGR02678 family protein [Candidatus Poriferisodalis sp.]|uniref:TIGR02678 family protein n=1 Tax=Candidatus Poriferisodalis sp. TaxID=3101277 RepID=UPI003B019BEE